MNSNKGFGGWNEARYSQVCRRMPSLSTSQDKTSKAKRITTTQSHPTMEVGTSYNGLRSRIPEVSERIKYNLGDRRLPNQIRTLPTNPQHHKFGEIAEIYIREIVRLHGVPISIIFDLDPRFTSKLWKSLHEVMGSRLNFSTAFHPQTNGQSERPIQTLEDMSRACIMDFGSNCESRLPSIEFLYNYSYQSSIKMAPYKALYGRKCRSPILWDELGER